MNRDEALKLINELINNKNLVKHMIATEAIMRSLAQKLKQDADYWGLVGLLHDLDFEQTKDRPDQHGLITEKILKEQGIENQEFFDAIKSHNAEGLGVYREKGIDKALTAAEQITGLIVGCALVMPDKKLSSVNRDTVLKKFKQKSFTANVNRNLIKLCEEIGFSLDDFIDLALGAMKEISGELGL